MSPNDLPDLVLIWLRFICRVNTGHERWKTEVGLSISL
jgi:hypothetical protein